MRLDIRDEALKPLKDGAIPIVPGDPDKSAIIQRIFAPAAAQRMPPAYAHKELTEQQKETIRRWVAEGAVYEGHWAYQPVKRQSQRASGSQPDRFFHSGTAGQRRAEAVPGSRPAHADPPRDARSHRPAPDARRSRWRLIATILRTLMRTWSTGCSPRPAMRSSRPCTGWTRCATPIRAAFMATTFSLPGRIAIMCCGVPRQHALRPVHARAAGGRPDAQRDARTESRVGLQPPEPHVGRRRLAAEGVSGQVRGRPRPHGQRRVARQHHGMRRMPRSQIRSVH